MISDVLVTADMLTKSNDDRYKKVYIPSIGGLFPHLTGTTSIAGMMQKSYVLPNGHIITFAGDVSDAYDFYAEMQSAKHANEVVSICAQFRERLQFMTCAVDIENTRLIICGSDDCRQLQLGDYGLVMIGGSGESTVRDLLLQQQAIPFSGDDELAPYARALCLVSEALALDHNNSQKTLDRKFGAYYEISFYANGGFMKLEGVLFSYWNVELRNDTLHWTPLRMFLHQYINDVLVVRRISFSSEAEGFAIWQDCYGIAGFHTKVSSKEVCEEATTSVPKPFMETVSAEFEGARFRFVSMDNPLVSFDARDGLWFPDINDNQLNIYSTRIFETMTGRR